MPRPVDFRSADFLQSHIQSIMEFYHPNCLSADGSFYQHFRDDGSIYDADTRHLVSSTRFVFNYAMAATHFDNSDYLQVAEKGLQALIRVHQNQQTQGYAWVKNGAEVLDDTNHCYGLAFVLLANATALKAGIEAGRDGIYHTWNLLEKHFWQDEHGLYADEANADFSQLDPYRGQNANMHTCEALLAAFEATKDGQFLSRAYRLANNMVNRQAGKGNDLIWEHYDSDWNIDWEYNKDDPKHLFRPWGYQPGHQTEWAKLLLILYRHKPEPWMIVRAQALFTTSVELAWDKVNGGICYGFAPDGSICDGDKYFWVQAESLAAAALLAKVTGKQVYWDWYDRIWAYAWEHMIDHKYGAWYRILNQQNQKYDDLKSPAGKTDYHTMGACYEVLNSLGMGDE